MILSPGSVRFPFFNLFLSPSLWLFSGLVFVQRNALQQSMKNAQSYEEWSRYAVQLDRLSGNDSWRMRYVVAFGGRSSVMSHTHGNVVLADMKAAFTTSRW